MIRVKAEVELSCQCACRGFSELDICKPLKVLCERHKTKPFQVTENCFDNKESIKCQFLEITTKRINERMIKW